MRHIPTLSFWRLAGAAAVAALIVTACGGTTSNNTKTKSGGTVTFAEAPGAPPNYIFPLESPGNFSVTNISDFSQIMYPPLYWFGTAGGQPVFNQGLSLAQKPVFNGKNVTINLKHWQWSNGKPITSRDVIFWMNLLSAATDPNAPTVGSSSAPGPGWGAEVPGGFPFNVVSYKSTGTYSLTMTLNGAYNPTWFLYNELSQITPMPQASWDKLSASGTVGNYDASAEARVALPKTSPTQYVPSNPGTATSGALGVAQFLNTQSQTLGTYATNPLWQVVSGSFHMTEFTTAGYVKMVPNKNYSGSPKPSISTFVEEPFTTDTAEFNALKAGQLTIGYVPTQDISQKALIEKSGYNFSPWYSFGFTYFPYNFTNPTSGPIFSQLYFRQAFQSLVNQPQYTKSFLANYANITNGPVPTYPKNNPDVSPLEAKGQVYPYSPSKAVSLLKSHGWSVKPGGVTTCTSPGQGSGNCGKGIAAGAQLNFKLLYASGSVAVTNEMEALQSTAEQQAGIKLNLSTGPFSQVIGTAFAGCTFATPCKTWDMANWGGGWVYAPDYFPTGGELFQTGSGSNGGDYSDSTDDANIVRTHTASNQTQELKALFTYEDYLAKQLPVVYMPTTPYQLTMYKSNLNGLSHQGIFDEIYPQYYSFS